MQNKETTRGHIGAIFTIFIWGTTFISTKYLLDSFSPIEILFFRFCIGYIALCIALPNKTKITDKKQELYFAAAGLCGVTLYFLMENIALTFSTASNVGVIISVAPFFTAMISHLITRTEKLKASFLIGFVVAMSGIIIINFNGAAVLKLNPIGDVLAVLAAFVWAIYSILMKKISTFGYHTIQTTRRSFFYGIIFMIPSILLMDFQLNPERFLQLPLLLNILFLGLAASAVCFVTWNYAVKVLGPVKTSVYIYATPVITVIFSAIILHEKITPLLLAGTILTLIGLFISESKHKPKEPSLCQKRKK